MQYQQFNLRLSPDLVAALKNIATATQRSQAGVVRWLIVTEASRLPSQATSMLVKGKEVAPQLVTE
jgi:hypothetical protein